MKEELMFQILKEAPVLAECIADEGEKSLRSFCESLVSINGEKGEALECYPSKELGEAVKNYLLTLVGGELSQKAKEQLETQRLILTANHHEAEFCVQSVQGNLLYSYILERMGYSNLVPIFSNTTVNMGNENYPRGIIVYHTSSDVLKLPVFPFRERNTLVCASGGFTEKMVERTLSEADRFRKNGTLAEETAMAVNNILQKHYLSEDVLKEESYAKQAFHINRQLAKKMYGDEKKEFLYIEMEAISSQLFKNDLSSSESPLLKNLLFQSNLRDKLILALDKVSGCWEMGTQKGTFLFWGVDERGRRVSLSLRTEGKEPYLFGVDMEKREYRYIYNEEGILSALEKKRLVPGLFLTFFELYLTRDFVPAGGCFQSIYLRKMCQGLIRVLETQKGYDREIYMLKRKKSVYLSGPMFLAALSKDKKAYPMGTVEIMERGGITSKELPKLLELSVKKSHEIGLFNFYPDLVAPSGRKENWRQKLSEEIGGTV